MTAMKRACALFLFFILTCLASYSYELILPKKKGDKRLFKKYKILYYFTKYCALTFANILTVPSSVGTDESAAASALAVENFALFISLA